MSIKDTIGLTAIGRRVKLAGLVAMGAARVTGMHKPGARPGAGPGGGQLIILPPWPRVILQDPPPVKPPTTLPPYHTWKVRANTYPPWISVTPTSGTGVPSLTILLTDYLVCLAETVTLWIDGFLENGQPFSQAIPIDVVCACPTDGQSDFPPVQAVYNDVIVTVEGPPSNFPTKPVIAPYVNNSYFFNTLTDYGSFSLVCQNGLWTGGDNKVYVPITNYQDEILGTPLPPNFAPVGVITMLPGSLPAWTGNITLSTI